MLTLEQERTLRQMISENEEVAIEKVEIEEVERPRVRGRNIILSMTARPASCGAVNKMLRVFGFEEKLKRIGGRFSFTGGGTYRWYSVSVNVPSVDCLTIREWMDEYADLSGHYNSPFVNQKLSVR